MLKSEFLLTDEQMMRFITKGYIVLQNDVPESLHQTIMKKIYHVLHEEGNPGNNILPRIPEIAQLFDTPIVKGGSDERTWSGLLHASPPVLSLQSTWGPKSGRRAMAQGRILVEYALPSAMVGNDLLLHT